MADLADNFRSWGQSGPRVSECRGLKMDPERTVFLIRARSRACRSMFALARGAR